MPRILLLLLIIIMVIILLINIIIIVILIVLSGRLQAIECPFLPWFERSSKSAFRYGLKRRALLTSDPTGSNSLDR